MLHVHHACHGNRSVNVTFDLSCEPLCHSLSWEIHINVTCSQVSIDFLQSQAFWRKPGTNQFISHELSIFHFCQTPCRDLDMFSCAGLAILSDKPVLINWCVQGALLSDTRYVLWESIEHGTPRFQIRRPTTEPSPRTLEKSCCVFLNKFRQILKFKKDFHNT